MGVLSFQGKRFFEMLSGASQVLNFGLLDQVFCTRSGRGRNSALTLGFLWVAPEPWYFYVDRELAVTTWVVFLFRVVRFRWGAPVVCLPGTRLALLAPYTGGRGRNTPPTVWISQLFCGPAT